MGVAEDNGVALWPTRYLTGGQLVIPDPPPARRPDRLPTVVGRVARTWRSWARWQQVLVVFFGGPLAAAPLGTVSEDLQGGAGVALWAVGGWAIWRTRRARSAARPSAPPLTPGQQLAAWDTTEARVAAAAGRAWAETAREPAWHSPFLASSRAAFDGQAEVGAIVDLALRIRQARISLGLRPAGSAAEYWDRQSAALENAARQLGRRADALIRYRDQAALLSAELRQLSDLERLERSAAEIDGLTVETASPSGRGDGGIGGVAEEIAAVRMAMTELIDLMTRTRAPLAEPPDATRYPT
ncbi:MAG: hypothetical protein M3Q47_15090 [Actinomycetota bacterium]|nr:hypothetical protein [Actinomycetota bacterium]